MLITWGTAGFVSLEGFERGDAAAIADRWCGRISDSSQSLPVGALRLVASRLDEAPRPPDPIRIRIRFRVGRDPQAAEFRVGAHAVVLGSGAAPDVLKYSARKPPSPSEFEFLVDMAVNHLLARQGLPVLHACAFEVEKTGILGLGAGFSGKTTVSMAALRSGGRVVSDDTVLVVPGEGNRLNLLPLRAFGLLRGRTREIVPHELRSGMLEVEQRGQPRWVLTREVGAGGFAKNTTPEVIWVQSVDRRLKESRISAINQGSVLAGLIRATSPIYLSRHLPEVRDQLIPVFRALSEGCRGYRLRLGRRLLDDPVGEMARLVEASR